MTQNKQAMQSEVQYIIWTEYDRLSYYLLLLNVSRPSQTILFSSVKTIDDYLTFIRIAYSL